MLALSALYARLRVSIVAREASVDEDEGGVHPGDFSSRSTSNGGDAAATHWCEACDRSMHAHQRRQHEQGRAHRKKVSEANANVATHWCEALHHRSRLFIIARDYLDPSTATAPITRPELTVRVYAA